MSTNLLKAIINMVTNTIVIVNDDQDTGNRINNMGVALETYIKDLFCNSFELGKNEKDYNIYPENFSYQGKKNKPPDLIIRNGDAVEVKKVETWHPEISLNSSYPKDKLYSDSPMLTKKCKECEEWAIKDLLYCIGTVIDSKIRCLWFVYGDCYAADKEYYETAKKDISSGILKIQEYDFSETNEIARINKVDPLEITDFRVRGMWIIKHPENVFNVSPVNEKAELSLYAIMKEDKYLSFPEEDKRKLESLLDDHLVIDKIKIRSPNNPMELLNGICIKYEI